MAIRVQMLQLMGSGLAVLRPAVEIKTLLLQLLQTGQGPLGVGGHPGGGGFAPLDHPADADVLHLEAEGLVFPHPLRLERPAEVFGGGRHGGQGFPGQPGQGRLVSRVVSGLELQPDFTLQGQHPA